MNNRMAKTQLVATPVFLVGAERSGTTLLRLMLSGHPQIDWANEFEFAVDRMPPRDGWPDLDSYYEFLSTHRVFRAGGYRIDRSLCYPDLISSFLAQRVASASTRTIGATVHRHFDRLLRIWPDARFIHLVRDPRDVAPSCMRLGWAGNTWTGVARWIEAERLWDALATGLSPDRALDLRFEALIDAPDATLQRVTSWLGVPYDERMLDYPDSTTYERPDPGLTQQWRRKLSEHEVRLVESRVGELLSDRRYAESGFAPLRVGTATVLGLRAHDRLKRSFHRLRELGSRLWAEDLLARALGIKAWQRSVILRKNEVIRARLK